MTMKIIKSLVLFLVFAFPLVYIQGFAFPGVFPRAMLSFLVIELLFFLFLWHSLSQGKIIIKKSYISISLVVYVVILFFSAIFGSDFGQSFWSSFFRMTGMVTWLHYLSFLFVATSVFTKEKDWQYIFRAILLSGFVLALVSFLGRDGLGTSLFSSIKEGGSLFGNTSYSGAYYVLAFFISLIGFVLESDKRWKGIYIFALATIFFNPDLFNFAVLRGSMGFSHVVENPLVLLGLARASTLVLWMGSLVLIFLFLLHKFLAKKLVMIVSVLTLVLMSGFYVYGFSSIIRHEGRIYNVYLKESGPARPIVWDVAVEGIKIHPILGYGPDNFNYVYQEHLDSRIINIEKSTEWFDNVHNFTLAQILEGGVVGAGIILLVFCMIVYASFKLYLQENRFYFLVTPFIFLFHFLQMQTFFQTDSALFLIFILLAFFISHEEDMEFKIPISPTKMWPKSAFVVFLISAIYFFVYIPAKENLLVSKILKTENRELRLGLYQNLCCLRVYPIGTLRLLSSQFMENTAPRALEFLEAGVTANIAEEYMVYINAYEKYLYRYKENYRYLLEYSNLINSAFIFGINELERGEELARQALEISKSYPHSYWVLAVNLYYQGKSKEALQYAKLAYELDPTVEKSREVYESLKEYSQVKTGINKTFLYLNI